MTLEVGWGPVFFPEDKKAQRSWSRSAVPLICPPDASPMLRPSRVTAPPGCCAHEPRGPVGLPEVQARHSRQRVASAVFVVLLPHPHLFPASEIQCLALEQVMCLSLCLIVELWLFGQPNPHWRQLCPLYTCRAGEFPVLIKRKDTCCCLFVSKDCWLSLL